MEEESRGGLAGILTRRIGPAPVWVYGAVLVLGLAWWLRSRAAKKAADSQNSQDASTLAGGAFPSANPMNYSSDIFINVTNPPTQPVDMPPVTPRPRRNGDNPPPVAIPQPPAPPAPAPIPMPAPPPVRTAITYVVQSGDTLWAIAQRLLGSGSRYMEIVNANRSMLDATARQHGFTSSDNGHWIWRGESLTIPS